MWGVCMAPTIDHRGTPCNALHFPVDAPPATVKT